MRQARQEITLSMAYFLPMGRVLRAMVKARRRGARVRVVVPEVSDVRLVQWATRHFYEYLLRRGIHIYERRDRMLHSKAMVVDDRWSVIGSCNLDARSLRINLEFFAVIQSRALAATAGRDLPRGDCRQPPRDDEDGPEAKLLAAVAGSPGVEPAEVVVGCEREANAQSPATISKESITTCGMRVSVPLVRSMKAQRVAALASTAPLSARSMR